MRKTHETIGTEPGAESRTRRERRDRTMDELFKLVPQTFGYADECMRVLNLNRQRPRNHPGRIFMARHIKTLRDIHRSRDHG